MLKHNHPDHIYCGKRSCPAFKFKPAFDMPTTAAEAVQVIAAWGHSGTMTFSSDRAKRCAQLLKKEIKEWASSTRRNSRKPV